MELSSTTLKASLLAAEWSKTHTPISTMRLNGRARSVLLGLHRRIRRAYERAKEMVKGAVPGVRRTTLAAHRGKSPSGTSRFMPGNIGGYIQSNQLYQLLYTCTWGARRDLRTARLRFAVYEQLELVDRTRFDDMAVRALSWLLVCSEIGPRACSTDLDVYFLRAPFCRQLPTSGATVLGPFQVNGGYATACAQAGEVVVYRVEEWFKVFVHETFHAFGLDAGAGSPDLMQLSRRILPVEASHDVREAYTETWARVINVIYCAGRKEKTFLKMCLPLLALERMFSVIQLGKVLRHMGTNIQCIQSEDAQRVCGYRENTNVLSYYVLGGALMHDLGSFLSWCAVHANGFVYFSPGPRRQASFGDLLTKAVQSPLLADELASFSRWPGVTDELQRSLRMTVVECWDGGTQN